MEAEQAPAVRRIGQEIDAHAEHAADALDGEHLLRRAQRDQAAAGHDARKAPGSNRAAPRPR